MSHIYTIIFISVICFACKRTSSKDSLEMKNETQAFKSQNNNNPDRIIVIDFTKCKEIFNKNFGVYLIDQPNNACNGTLSRVERINLERLTKRMNNLVYLLKQKCLEDCKNDPTYHDAEYKNRFDKYIAQTEASFTSYLEAMGYLHTPDLLAFSGSSSYRTKNEFEIKIIKHRIIELKELLQSI